MMLRSGRTLVALVGAVALSGCAALSDPDPAADGEVRIVASLYPLAWATQMVAGDDYEVTNLTTPGGEPHDLELGVQQTADVETADLVVYESGFQPAVDEAVDDLATAELVDAHDLIPDSVPPGHDEEADQDHDDHVHGEVDPHFWLDPLLLADLGDAVAERLAEVAPEDADGFVARAADLRAELERLDRTFADGLADCERHVVVVSHAAYSYLARYGPSFAAITQTPDTEPTPADLARLEELVRTEEVTTVFYEPLGGPDVVESVARDLDLDVEVLDPIEGLTDLTADEDYLSLMRANLAALQEANGCP
jgi:zinc transport system substrate-binding protein